MPLIRNRAGFTLIEVMIAIGIVAMAALAVLQATVSLHKESKSIKLLSTRSEIARQIRIAAKNIRSYENSKTLVPGLVPCLEVSTTSGSLCLSKADPTDTQLLKHDLVLYSPFDASEPLGGPESQTGSLFPVYYNVDGQRCEPDRPGNECPLQAIVTYSAVCPMNTANCIGAEVLQINYTVRLRPDIVPEAIGLRNMRGEVGSGFLVVNDGSHLKIYDALSMSGGFLSELETAQGKVLSAANGEEVRMRVTLRDPLELDELQVRMYKLPGSCTFTEFGTPSCPRPAYADYELVKTLPLGAGTKSGQFMPAFNTTSSGFAEVVILGLKDGSFVRRSETSLKLKTPAMPIFDVAGPMDLTRPCTPGKKHDFTFQGRDDAGLAEVSASISPPLPSAPDGSLPGFLFDLHNENPQTYSIGYDAFVPDATYTIHFNGKTAMGKSLTDTHTFKVLPSPEPGLTIVTPAAGSFIRTVDNLVIQSRLVLDCGQTPDQVTFSTSHNSAPLMTDKPSVCTKEGSDPDENVYLCNITFPCNTWLNIGGSCADFPNPDSAPLVLDGKAQSSTGENYTAQRQVGIGGKISVRLAEFSTQFPILKDHYSKPTLPVQLVFGGSSDDNIKVVLTAATGVSQAFSCPTSTGSCDVAFPVPPSATTISLEVHPDSAAVAEVKSPKVASVMYDNRFSSCATQSSPPVCPAGKTLKQKVQSVVPHDGEYKSYTWGGDIKTQYPIEPGANVDFHMIGYRNSTAKDKLGFSMILFHFNADGDVEATTQTANTFTPATETPQFFYVDDSYWQFYTSKSYVSAASISMHMTGGAFDSLYFRQCYCQ